MTYYAHVVDVPAPAEIYDATHAELLRRTAGKVDGLVMHLCRATDTGFQVTEVWTDQASFERAERELVGPMLAEQAKDTPPAPLRAQEFAVRGLVIPGAGIAT